ncbi:Hypp9107 [Branchiostoma lanceolatum]|uniref:Hypp9107 protein n=1 Tax=Branchiostoma lanceolatum TaxID=7740 RepID=A0A8K0EK32_BRALA|nr:Hypp9107 [Branchiostoma lanceolatum]
MGDEKFEDESGGRLDESEKELPSTTEALEDRFRVWEESPRDDLDDAATENQEAETDRSVPDDNRAGSVDVRQESVAGRQDKMMLQPEERTPSNLSDDVFERRRRSSSTGPVIFTTPPSQDDLRVEPEVFYEPGRERDDSIPTNEAGASLSTLGENAEDPNKTTNSPGENGRHTGLNGKDEVANGTKGTDTNSAADAKAGKDIKKRKSRLCVLL